jgi:hypothetical protein
MRMFGFLGGRRGGGVACQGHHWHMASSGWRCCGCPDTYPVGDRPDSAVVECRLGNAAGRHHLAVEDPDSAAWLDELMSPEERTGELPGLGRRKLTAGAGRLVRAAAVVRGVGAVAGQRPGLGHLPRHRAGGR